MERNLLPRLSVRVYKTFLRIRSPACQRPSVPALAEVYHTGGEADVSFSFETIFDLVHGVPNGVLDTRQSIAKSVIGSDRSRTLINSYLDCEIGICLHFYSRCPTLESKCREYILVFKKSGSDLARENRIP